MRAMLMLVDREEISRGLAEGLEYKDIALRGTVALSQRTPSSRFTRAKQDPQSCGEPMTNRASEPCCRASGGADEARSSGLIGQCNSALTAPLAVSRSLPDDREAYTAGKSEFILAVLKTRRAGHH